MVLQVLPPSPILEFNPNQVEVVRKTFNYDPVNKLEQDLDNFEDWIKKQSHFVVQKFDRDYLERFLMASKGSVEIAKKRFDKLCTFRTLMPEFLKNFDADEFSRVKKWSYIGVLPKPLKDNYRVLVTMIHTPEPLENVNFMEFYRFLASVVEYLFKHDYNAGYEVIYDTRMFGLGVVSKLSPIEMKKCSTIFLEALGFRLKRLHIISGSKMFDLVLSLVKQALTEKLVKRIVIHNSPEAVAQYLSEDILPPEFGGTEKSMRELNQLIYEEMSTKDHLERLKILEEACTDETKRISYSFNEEYLGMPGSFKTLCVD